MDKLIRKWDDSLTPSQHEKLAQSLKRRNFLGHSIKLATTISLLPAINFITACSEDPAGLQRSLEGKQPWATFALVQTILFPADGNGPGAADVYATAYLKFVLEAVDTDPDDREFILGGIEWLDALAQEDFKQPFSSCPADAQDKLIHKTSQSKAGKNWLSNLLLYIFEALLSDPVYGGNPGGIGWKWLKHQPGFPTPPADKRYIELL